MTSAPTLDTPEPVGAPGPTRRGRLRKLLPLLLVLAGILVLLYPVFVTYQRNEEQGRAAESYRDFHSTMDETDRRYWLDRAREYNRWYAGGPLLDPWLSDGAREDEAYRAYQAELNPAGEDDAVFAALAVPSIDLQLPVRHGTENHTLEDGVGHLYGSALPVGGEGMHSVLTAHTGLSTATLFDRLVDVEEGEDFYIDVMGELLRYEVDQISVVTPQEAEELQPVVGRDLVTLLTCTPYGVNNYRLLVRGTRVPLDDPAGAQRVFDDSGRVWQPWMIAVVAVVALIAALALIWFLINRYRRRAARAEETHGTEEKNEEGNTQ